VVCDEGVEHGVEVNEAQGWGEYAGEEEHGGERAAGDFFSQEKERCEQSEEGDGGEVIEGVGDGLACGDVETGIDLHDGVGDEEFPDVEPEGAAGDEESLEEGEGELRACGADVLGFEVGGEPAHEGGDEEEGESPEDVAEGDSAAAPPDHQEEHGADDAGGGFREHGGDEQEEGEEVGWPVAPPKPRITMRGSGGGGVREDVEAFEGEIEGGEEEDAAETVFSLGDPGDGFDAGGMDGEDEGAEPGAELSAGEFEAMEDEVDEAGGDHVEDEVVEVVGEATEEAVGAPGAKSVEEAAFEPIGGEDEGVIVRGSGGGEPDVVEEAGLEDEGVACEPLVVVPDVNAVEGGVEGDESDEQESGNGEDSPE